jgi:xanthine/uracil permease
MAYILFIAVFLIEPIFMGGSYSQGLDTSFGHALLAGLFVVAISAIVSTNRYQREP